MKTLNTIEDIEKVVEQSEEGSVVIFKHSTTCPISEHARERVVAGIESGEITAPVYEVVVQEAREVSDAIADKLDVQHESPQAIVLRRGAAVFHASHGDITVETLIEE